MQEAKFSGMVKSVNFKCNFNFRSMFCPNSNFRENQTNTAVPIKDLERDVFQ